MQLLLILRAGIDDVLQALEFLFHASADSILSAPGGSRTRNHLYIRQVLIHLSFRGM